MKKILFLVLSVSGCMFGAAKAPRPKSTSKSVRAAVTYAPASVVITAIINQAHNPVSVMNAQGKERDKEKLSVLSCTIPAGKSTVDEAVCSKQFYTVVPYECEPDKKQAKDVSVDLTKFHITTGHGTYTFANSQYDFAAYMISRNGEESLKMKRLLLPWREERKVELVIGHDGKLEMRVPGSLSKHVRSEKSKAVKK